MEDDNIKMTEAEYISNIQKMQAELENSRKRMEKEKEDIIINANSKLILNLLPVIDNFELALKYNHDRGIEMIYNELFKVLEKEGVKAINNEGIYDAHVHEVISQSEGSEDGKITHVVQKGYTMNGKLLRASKVKITKVMKK